MEVRLQFEWTDDKAKKFVDHMQNAGFLGQGYDDIGNRDDSIYEVRLEVKLKNKRKTRKKKEDWQDPSLPH